MEAGVDPTNFRTRGQPSFLPTRLSSPTDVYHNRIQNTFRSLSA